MKKLAMYLILVGYSLLTGGQSKAQDKTEFSFCEDLITQEIINHKIENPQRKQGMGNSQEISNSNGFLITANPIHVGKDLKHTTLITVESEKKMIGESYAQLFKNLQHDAACKVVHVALGKKMTFKRGSEAKTVKQKTEYAVDVRFCSDYDRKFYVTPPDLTIPMHAKQVQAIIDVQIMGV